MKKKEHLCIGVCFSVLALLLAALLFIKNSQELKKQAKADVSTKQSFLKASTEGMSKQEVANKPELKKSDVDK